MAITRTGNNLPNQYFIPEIYSKETEIVFDKESVSKAILTSKHTGEIKKKGDVVHIRKIGNMALQDYTTGGKTNWTELEDDEVTLTIDIAKLLAFKINDIDIGQTDIKGLMALYGERGAYVVADDYDQAVFAVHASATGAIGTTGSPTDCGYGTSEVSPIKVLAQAGRMLSVQNAPRRGRWGVVPPHFTEQLMDESGKGIDASVIGSGPSALTNGLLRKNFMGFDLYESNNLATDGTYYAAMFGCVDSIVGAQQITLSEKIRLQDEPADGIRMMSVYGVDVIRPEGLVTAYLKFD